MSLLNLLEIYAAIITDRWNLIKKYLNRKGNCKVNTIPEVKGEYWISWKNQNKFLKDFIKIKKKSKIFRFTTGNGTFLLTIRLKVAFIKF